MFDFFAADWLYQERGLYVLFFRFGTTPGTVGYIFPSVTFFFFQPLHLCSTINSFFTRPERGLLALSLLRHGVADRGVSPKTYALNDPLSPEPFQNIKSFTEYINMPRIRTSRYSSPPNRYAAQPQIITDRRRMMRVLRFVPLLALLILRSNMANGHSSGGTP